MRCGRYLAKRGPSRGAAVKAATGVEAATRMMRDDHYGWFGRIAKGRYALTPKGLAEITAYPELAPVT